MSAPKVVVDAANEAYKRTLARLERVQMHLKSSARSGRLQGKVTITLRTRNPVSSPLIDLIWECLSTIGLYYNRSRQSKRNWVSVESVCVVSNSLKLY